MKHFNQMAEKQMANAKGGELILFIYTIMAIAMATSAGAIGGTIGGLAARDKIK